MAARGRSALSRNVHRYTAQDVARFCEVDLKTVHHWADRGKIPHERTSGRHLRFRRNDVVRFLRVLEYPLPPVLTETRPTVALAMPALEGSLLTPEELGRKLSTRFVVRRFESAIAGISALLADEPDAIVFALDDPSMAGMRTIEALKSVARTRWAMVAVVGDEALLDQAKRSGSDVTVAGKDIAKLGLELARALAVTDLRERP